MAAAWKGHNKTVELLLAKGADVNMQGGHLGTALVAAASEDHNKTVELLLAKGADSGAALQVAALRFHVPVIRQLLARGAEYNIRDSHGWTVIDVLMHIGDAQLFELFPHPAVSAFGQKNYCLAPSALVRSSSTSTAFISEDGLTLSTGKDSFGNSCSCNTNIISREH
jgi:hypothetical protein